MCRLVLFKLAIFSGLTTSLGILNYTNIKGNRFNATECGKGGLVIPGESCINCFYLEAELSTLEVATLVSIHSKTKNQNIYNRMRQWGVTEAVIGLRSVASGYSKWTDKTTMTYKAWTVDAWLGLGCFAMITKYPEHKSWFEIDCGILNKPRYFIYEWTNKAIPQELVLRDKNKAQEDHICSNNESTSFGFNCSVNCPNTSSEMNCAMTPDTQYENLSKESKDRLFRCRTNEFISFALECDQEVDCSDASDEINCVTSNAECFVSEIGRDYDGITRTGELDVLCQRWDSQTPNSHKYQYLADNENFCRQTHLEPKPWCYSVDSAIRWVYCHNPICGQHTVACMEEGDVEFMGHVNVTKSGLVCQRWDTNYPNSHNYYFLADQENYCRITIDKPSPWCFTTNVSVPWEFCDIPACGDLKCPEGYTECPSGVCISVHKVCDGTPDCPNEEDERNCGEFACPGSFKCRGRSKCVSLNFVCDGTADCPNGDDELLCDFQCPAGCICHGLSFKCNAVPVPDTQISKYARAIDFSDISLHIVTLNLSYTNLAFFNLSNCRIDSLYSNSSFGVFEHLKNLLVLDLSYNNLSFLPSNSFKGLNYLQRIFLDNNVALERLYSNTFDNQENLLTLSISYTNISDLRENEFQALKALRILNLKHNKIAALKKGVFKGLISVRKLYLEINRISHIELRAFSDMHSLRVLNLSHNEIQTLEKGVFARLSFVSSLDVRGNDIRITKDMFYGLGRLQVLETKSYELCCMIPSTITGQHVTCTAKTLQVMSCENLIELDVLRIAIWIIGCCAMVGNVTVLFYRLIYDKARLLRSYSIFIVSLSISDLLMGVYMIIVATMDVTFRGKYIWNDQSWRQSKLCATAGFIATISSESSAMLICLVATDRFIAIKFPFSKFKLKPKWSIVFSVLCFLLSILLAAIPLIPGPYFDGRFYSRSSVCIALPLTTDRPQGWEYSVIVFIGINMVLFLIVGITQLLIYRDIKNTMVNARNRRLAVDIKVAKSLLTVVMTDFFCWVPVGTMGILALADVEIPSNVYAWTIVFVLPVNSALNPFLYTFSEIRRKRSLPMQSVESIRYSQVTMT